MTDPPEIFGPEFREFDDSITPEEIEKFVSSPKLRRIQCSEPVTNRTWDLLNSSFFSRRPDVWLRVYGLVTDLSFIPRMHNVRHFAADCLIDTAGVEHVGTLRKLESLSVGIFELKDFEFLADTPHTLKQLSLGMTKSKKPRLGLLKRFDALVTLYLEGQQNDIEVLAELRTLEDVTLRSISTPNLSYLRPLDRLRSLDIKLGGIASLYGIEGKSSIKYLELWQIKGLSDISVVSSLSGLQYLFLQSLKHVRQIPDLSRLPHLRRVYLDNMSGLKDLSALEGAPGLEDFVHISARNFAPAHYQGLLHHPKLRSMLVGFGSDRKNRVLEAEMAKVGVEKYSGREFVFR